MYQFPFVKHIVDLGYLSHCLVVSLFPHIVFLFLGLFFPKVIGLCFVLSQ